jgi:hypothetical protein
MYQIRFLIKQEKKKIWEIIHALLDPRHWGISQSTARHTA